MEALLKLQEAQIRSDLPPGKDNTTTRRFRKMIPEQIQGHFDRIRARGKKGVSTVKNGACTGCYMKVPMATLLTIRRGEDIRLCDNCGRYLFLPEDEVVGTQANAAKEKEAKAAARKAKAKTKAKAE